MGKALCTAFLWSAVVSCAFGQAQVKIGLIAPFSGPLGFIGAEIHNATQVLPIQWQKTFEIVRCDSAMNPERAAECARSLAEREKVSAVVGPFLSVEDQAVRALLADRRVLQISLAAASTRSEPPQTYFRMREDPGELATYAASFITRTLRPKKLTIVAQENFLVRGKTWKDVLPGIDLRQITVKAFPELRAAAEQAAADDSEVVYLAYNLPLQQQVDFAKALKAKKVVVSVPYRTPLVFPGMPNLIMVGLGEPGSERGKNFDAAYLKQHGSLPSSAAAYHTFAAFEVLADVFLTRRARSTEEAAGLIRSTKFQTVLGTMGFEPQSREALSALPFSVVEYKAGTKVTTLVQSTGGTGCNCAYSSCCNKGCCPQDCSGTCAASRTFTSFGFLLVALGMGDGGCRGRE